LHLLYEVQSMINLRIDKTTNNPNRRNKTKENQKKELNKNAEMCFEKFFEQEVKKLLTKYSKS